MVDRELALLLDSGILINDSSWRCVADVMSSFHGFGTLRSYGVIVDAQTLEQVYPPKEDT